MTRRRTPVRGAGKSPPGRVRIVAGKWRGRRLAVAAVPGLRPTSERIRETLFNWLAPAVEGARCLDLFAGTGALGLEALSRGAAHVMFVERSALALQALKETVAALGAANAVIHAGDALEYLRKTEPGQHDIVFLDPPFGGEPSIERSAERLEELCRLLAERPWLAPDAVVYLEEERDSARPALPDGWRVTREKSAGNVRYSLIAAGGSRQQQRGAGK